MPIDVHTLPVGNVERVFESIVCSIAVGATNKGNVNRDAIGTPKDPVFSGAGRGSATFERSACIGNGSVNGTQNGGVDKTHKNKGQKDVFEEEHDVEIRLLEKMSSSGIN